MTQRGDLGADGALAGARILLPCVLEELKRQDTEHPIFHGSWDWHSACHGHWAALRAADLIGDVEALSWVVSRLRSGGLRREIGTLEGDPEFERPYGRAWFLRLMLAYETVTGDQTSREAVQPIADALQSWLRGMSLGPEISEYGNCTWALVQLHAWSRTVGDVGTRDWIRGVARDHFLGLGPDLGLDHEGRGEFFSRWALQALLVDATLGAATLRDWLGEQAIEDRSVRVIERPRSAHHLGMNASRAWGLWSAYRATGEERWLEAYHQHTAASMALHQTWEHDRRSYTHWVPQFTLYALLRPLQEPLLA